MSTSIRIWDRTKRKLEALKREDETFDDLLARLARTEEEVEALAGFADQPVDRGLEAAREDLDDVLDERTDRLE